LGNSFCSETHKRGSRKKSSQAPGAVHGGEGFEQDSVSKAHEPMRTRQGGMSQKGETEPGRKKEEVSNKEGKYWGKKSLGGKRF